MTSVAAKKLRERLREQHQDKPGTQADLARALGVTAQSVNQWLSGLSRPDPANMAAIETLFDIPMREWVESAEEPAA